MDLEQSGVAPNFKFGARKTEILRNTSYLSIGQSRARMT
jgi:hypothetical protein